MYLLNRLLCRIIGHRDIRPPVNAATSQVNQLRLCTRCGRLVYTKDDGTDVVILQAWDD